MAVNPWIEFDRLTDELCAAIKARAPYKDLEKKWRKSSYEVKEYGLPRNGNAQQDISARPLEAIIS